MSRPESVLTSLALPGTVSFRDMSMCYVCTESERLLRINRRLSRRPNDMHKSISLGKNRTGQPPSKDLRPPTTRSQVVMMHVTF
jgi:hypothetical protein